MGKTKNQLDLSWESLLWNMQTENNSPVCQQTKEPSISITQNRS